MERDEARAEIERLRAENELLLVERNKLREALAGSEHARLLGEQKLAAKDAENERLRQQVEALTALHQSALDAWSSRDATIAHLRAENERLRTQLEEANITIRSLVGAPPIQEKP
jgi:chromosome segregation ATPase